MLSFKKQIAIIFVSRKFSKFLIFEICRYTWVNLNAKYRPRASGTACSFFRAKTFKKLFRFSLCNFV